MLGERIKGDEVCAWCGVHMHGVGHKVSDDHICMKCFRGHLVEKRQSQKFWEKYGHEKRLEAMG